MLRSLEANPSDTRLFTPPFKEFSSRELWEGTFTFCGTAIKTSWSSEKRPVPWPGGSRGFQKRGKTAGQLNQLVRDLGRTAVEGFHDGKGENRPWTRTGRVTSWSIIEADSEGAGQRGTREGQLLKLRGHRGDAVYGRGGPGRGRGEIGTGYKV